MILLSLTLCAALLAPPLGTGADADAGNVTSGTGVLIKTVLIQLATRLDTEAGPPASLAEATARLQSAGLALPAGLQPDEPLRAQDASALSMAVGLKLTNDQAEDAIVPAPLVEALVDLLRLALVSKAELSR